MSETPTTSPVVSDVYEIERELGHGGMATVYLARDRRHARQVALKVLHLELSQALGVERFQREIAITASLTHPNILPLHDSGQSGQRLFYVTPYIGGETLRERLNREGQLPLRDAIGITRGVASALEHAHARGIVHRDIKPENILMADGQPMVADFGIARMVQETTDEGLTATGVTLGTPAYMSPEQVSGEHVDARSDIYSTGCLLYEMFAGEPPFTGPTAQAILAKRLANPAPDVRQLRDIVPDVLADTVARTLARVPADRFQSAVSLRAALDEAELQSASMPSRAPRRPRGDKATAWRSAPNIATAALAASILAVAVIPGARHWIARAWGQGQTVRTIAVLPLDDGSGSMASPMGGPGMGNSSAMGASGDMDAGMGQDFFSDGLTDAVISGLSQLGAVNVISKMSVMQYVMMKRPLADIAHDLHADIVFRAAVKRSGDSLRISAELVRPSDQTTIWTHSYERPLGDALALESDIADAVAREIGARFVARRAAPPVVVKPQSQEEYLKGAYFAAQWRLPEAIEAFEHAVAIDPNHATAYAALGRAYYFRAFFGEIAPAEAFSQIRRAATAALQQDPNSAEAHGLLALVETHYDWNWAAAEQHFREALALSPSDAQVHHDFAHFLLAAGRRRESVVETKRALELDPANPMLTSCVGWHSLFDKQFHQAESFASESQRMMPSFWASVVKGWAYLGMNQTDSALIAMRTADSISKGIPFTKAALAHALAKAGRKAEARQILQSLIQQSVIGYVSAYDIAIVYAGLDETEPAIEWLRKAIGERSMFVVHLTWDARLDRLHGDPRFAEFVKEIGAPTAKPGVVRKAGVSS